MGRGMGRRMVLLGSSGGAGSDTGSTAAGVQLGPDSDNSESESESESDSNESERSADSDSDRCFIPH